MFAEASIVGGVLSIPIGPTVSVRGFPALSVAVPLTGVFPSALTTTGDGQLATPESWSLHVNVTVTF